MVFLGFGGDKVLDEILFEVLNENLFYGTALRKRRSGRPMMDELSLVAMKAVAIYIQGCRGQEQCSANIGIEGLSPFEKTKIS